MPHTLIYICYVTTLDACPSCYVAGPVTRLYVCCLVDPTFSSIPPSRYTFTDFGVDALPACCGLPVTGCSWPVVIPFDSRLVVGRLILYLLLVVGCWTPLVGRR